MKKISSQVDERVWRELQELADESDRTISGVLTEAVEEYLDRRRVRPVVRERLEDSIAENERLGELLAR